MHHQVVSHRSADLLELGAGTLNHIPHEHPNTVYDIVEPFAELYQNSSRLDQVNNIYNSLCSGVKGGRVLG